MTEKENPFSDMSTHSCAECGTTPDRALIMGFKPKCVGAEYASVLLVYFLCDECFSYDYDRAGARAIAAVGRDMSNADKILKE